MLQHKHLIDIDEYSADEIVEILDTARSFKEVNDRAIKKLPTLRGRTIINLFLEPSTRTRTSFEIAGKRLSGDVINFSASSSSTTKGETLADTAETLDAMNCDLIVVRSKQEGAPRILTQHMDAHVVNGGDGKHQRRHCLTRSRFARRSDTSTASRSASSATSRTPAWSVRSCRCSRSWVPSPS